MTHLCRVLILLILPITGVVTGAPPQVPAARADLPLVVITDTR